MREIDGTGIRADLYQNDYTKKQNLQFTAAFTAITEAFKEQQVAGTDPSETAVQELVKRHYEFCLQFWTPSRAAYKGLAQSYLLPSEYRDSYESVNPGLAKYHHDAIVIWADQNLQ
jgi:TipAS antibiotic-recognition domain